MNTLERIALIMAPDRSAPWWLALEDDGRDGSPVSIDPNEAYIFDHLADIEAKLTPDQRTMHTAALDIARAESLAHLLS